MSTEGPVAGKKRKRPEDMDSDKPEPLHIVRRVSLQVQDLADDFADIGVSLPYVPSAAAAAATEAATAADPLVIGQKMQLHAMWDEKFQELWRRQQLESQDVDFVFSKLPIRIKPRHATDPSVTLPFVLVQSGQRLDASLFLPVVGGGTPVSQTTTTGGGADSVSGSAGAGGSSDAATGSAEFLAAHDAIYTEYIRESMELIPKGSIAGIAHGKSSTRKFRETSIFALRGNDVRATRRLAKKNKLEEKKIKQKLKVSDASEKKKRGPKPKAPAAEDEAALLDEYEQNFCPHFEDKLETRTLGDRRIKPRPGKKCLLCKGGDNKCFGHEVHAELTTPINLPHDAKEVSLKSRQLCPNCSRLAIDTCTATMNLDNRIGVSPLVSIPLSPAHKQILFADVPPPFSPHNIYGDNDKKYIEPPRDHMVEIGHRLMDAAPAKEQVRIRKSLELNGFIHENCYNIDHELYDHYCQIVLIRDQLLADRHALGEKLVDFQAKERKKSASAATAEAKSTDTTASGAAATVTAAGKKPRGRKKQKPAEPEPAATTETAAMTKEELRILERERVKTRLAEVNAKLLHYDIESRFTMPSLVAQRNAIENLQHRIKDEIERLSLTEISYRQASLYARKIRENAVNYLRLQGASENDFDIDCSFDLVFLAFPRAFNESAIKSIRLVHAQIEKLNVQLSGVQERLRRVSDIVAYAYKYVAARAAVYTNTRKERLKNHANHPVVYDPAVRDSWFTHIHGDEDEYRKWSEHKERKEKRGTASPLPLPLDEVILSDHPDPRLDEKETKAKDGAKESKKKKASTKKPAKKKRKTATGDVKVKTKSGGAGSGGGAGTGKIKGTKINFAALDQGKKRIATFVAKAVTISSLGASTSGQGASGPGASGGAGGAAAVTSSAVDNSIVVQDIYSAARLTPDDLEFHSTRFKTANILAKLKDPEVIRSNDQIRILKDAMDTVIARVKRRNEAVRCSMALGGCGAYSHFMKKFVSVAVSATLPKETCTLGNIWNGGAPLSVHSGVEFRAGHFMNMFRRVSDQDQRVLGHDPVHSPISAMTINVFPIPSSKMNSSIEKLFEKIITISRAQKTLLDDLELQYNRTFAFGELNETLYPTSEVAKFTQGSVEIQNLVCSIIADSKPIPKSHNPVAAHNQQNKSSVVNNLSFQLNRKHGDYSLRGQVTGRNVDNSHRGPINGGADMLLGRWGIGETMQREIPDYITVTSQNIEWIKRWVDHVFAKRRQRDLIRERQSLEAMCGNSRNIYTSLVSDTDVYSNDVSPACFTIFKPRRSAFAEAAAAAGIGLRKDALVDDGDAAAEDDVLSGNYDQIDTRSMITAYSKIIQVGCIIEVTAGVFSVTAVTRAPALSKESVQAQIARIIYDSIRVQDLGQGGHPLFNPTNERNFYPVRAVRHEPYECIAPQHETNTVVMHHSMTTSLNADFDGDAMLQVFFKRLLAKLQSLQYIGVNNMFLNAEANSSNFGLVQANITGLFKRTRANELLTFHQFVTICSSLSQFLPMLKTRRALLPAYQRRVPDPAVFLDPIGRTRPRWCMRQLVSMMFPATLFYHRGSVKYGSQGNPFSSIPDDVAKSLRDGNQGGQGGLEAPLGKGVWALRDDERGRFDWHGKDEPPYEWETFRYAPHMVVTDADGLKTPIIYNGQLVQGTLTAEDMAPNECGLMKQMVLQYGLQSGSEAALTFLSDVSVLNATLFRMHTSSVVHHDLDLPTRVRINMRTALDKLKKEQREQYRAMRLRFADKRSRRLHIASLAGHGEVTIEMETRQCAQHQAELENHLMNQGFDLAEVVEKTATELLTGHKLPTTNVKTATVDGGRVEVYDNGDRNAPFTGISLRSAILSGAKGKAQDFMEMTLCVGMLLVDNKYVPGCGHIFRNNRTLPHFASGHTVEQRGWSDTSYWRGGNEVQEMQKAMSGLPKVTDSSTTVFRPGRVYKKLVKGPGEDAAAQMDGSVRDADGHVLTLRYGGDGLNPERLVTVSIPTVEFVIAACKDKKMPAAIVASNYAAAPTVVGGADGLAQILSRDVFAWQDRKLGAEDARVVAEESAALGKYYAQLWVPMIKACTFTVGARRVLSFLDIENFIVGQGFDWRSKSPRQLQKQTQPSPKHIVEATQRLCDRIDRYGNPLIDLDRNHFALPMTHFYIKSVLCVHHVLYKYMLSVDELDLLLEEVFRQYQISRLTPGTMCGMHAASSIRPMTQKTLNLKKAQNNQTVGATGVIALEQLTMLAKSNKVTVVSCKIRPLAPTPGVSVADSNVITTKHTPADIRRLFIHLNTNDFVRSLVMIAWDGRARTRKIRGFDYEDSRVVHEDRYELNDLGREDGRVCLVSDRTLRLLLDTRECSASKVDYRTIVSRMRETLTSEFVIHAEHLPREDLLILHIRLIRGAAAGVAAAPLDPPRKTKRKTEGKDVSVKMDEDDTNEELIKRDGVVVHDDATAGAAALGVEGAPAPRRKKRAPSGKTKKRVIVHQDTFMLRVIRAILPSCLPGTGITDLSVDPDGTMRMILAPNVCTPQKLRAIMTRQDIHMDTVSFNDPRLNFVMFDIDACRVSIAQEWERSMADLGYIMHRHGELIASWMTYQGFPVPVNKTGIKIMTRSPFVHATLEQGAANMTYAANRGIKTGTRNCITRMALGIEAGTGCNFQPVLTKEQVRARQRRSESSSTSHGKVWKSQLQVHSETLESYFKDLAEPESFAKAPIDSEAAADSDQDDGDGDVRMKPAPTS